MLECFEEKRGELNEIRTLWRQVALAINLLESFLFFTHMPQQYKCHHIESQIPKRPLHRLYNWLNQIRAVFTHK